MRAFVALPDTGCGHWRGGQASFSFAYSTVEAADATQAAIRLARRWFGPRVMVRRLHPDDPFEVVDGETGEWVAGTQPFRLQELPPRAMVGAR